MTKLYFENGNTYDFSLDQNEQPNTAKETVSGVPVYDSATSKVIKNETGARVDENISVSETSDNKKETLDVNQTDKGTSVTFQTQRKATPLSVLSQLSRGFIESLLYLPDKTIEEVAEGISDTFNLGWQDTDIFQFHKLLNDGKAGYMQGTF